jgi:hypothetical protein
VIILNNTMTGASAAIATGQERFNAGYSCRYGWPCHLTLSFDPAGLKLIDDVSGDITKTVIPSISATDADNKVFIINRGTGGGVAAKGWVKIRVLRNGTTGYTLTICRY